MICLLICWTNGRSEMCSRRMCNPLTIIIWRAKQYYPSRRFIYKLWNTWRMTSMIDFDEKRFLETIFSTTFFMYSCTRAIIHNKLGNSPKSSHFVMGFHVHGVYNDKVLLHTIGTFGLVVPSEQIEIFQYHSLARAKFSTSKNTTIMKWLIHTI